MRGNTWRHAPLALVFGLAACGGGHGSTPDAHEAPDAQHEAPDAMSSDTTPPTSVAAPAGGTYIRVPRVIISADEPATIYYTTDGSAPTQSSASAPAPLVLDTAVAGTAVRYFAVDTAGNVETPDHSDTYAVDADATLSIALVGQTVTVTDPPAEIDLSGTVLYDDAANTATVTLTATSTSTRLLFNLKGVYDAPSQGTLAADNLLDGAQFSYFGPEALDTGATKIAQSFIISGVDGTVDPVTVDVHFRTDAMWISNGGYDNGPCLVDSSGGGMILTPDNTAFGYRGVDGDTPYHDGVVTADGRDVYLGVRNMPTVVHFDMTTDTATVGASLDAGIGAVATLELSPDGQYLYATLLTGDHLYGNYTVGAGTGGAGCQNGSGTCANTAPDAYVVKLRRSDLTEVGRVAVFTDATDPLTRPGDLSLSVDGTRAAVATPKLGTVALIDTSDMSVIQSVDVSGTMADPEFSAFSADGATLFLAAKDGATSDLATVNTSTFAVATKTTGITGTHRSGFLRVYGDQLFFGSRDANLSRCDLTAGTCTDLGAVGVRGFMMVSGGRYAYADNNEIDVRTVADDTAVLINGGSGVTIDGFGHMLVATPD